MKDQSDPNQDNIYHIITLEMLVTSLISVLSARGLLITKDVDLLISLCDAAVSSMTSRSETSFQITGERVREQLKVLLSTVR